MFKSKRASIIVALMLLAVSIAITVYVILTIKTMSLNTGSERAIASSISDFANVGYSMVAIFALFALLFLLRAYFFVGIMRAAARVKYIVAEFILLIGVCAIVVFVPVGAKAATLMWQIFAICIAISYIYTIIYIKVMASMRNIAATAAKS